MYKPAVIPLSRFAIIFSIAASLAACQSVGRAHHVAKFDGPTPTQPVKVVDESTYHDAKSRRVALATDLSKFFDNAEIAVRDFFIDEATEAGVTRFGPMLPPGKRAKSQNKLCGVANRNTFIVLININNSICMNLRTFAHEIAHVAVFDIGCFGHGTAFYQYLTGIAERFEARFPGVQWLGRQPTESVYDQSLQYHVNEKNC